ncbi:MAG: DUF3794 domain-containing protein [Ruminococcaceae bacterium]|nr:DUF3794 domain-containing protein [Oscillospiraceae bacterium]
MEITLQKEMLSLKEHLGHRQTEVHTESDIIVPDTKPDIGKILQTDGRARITACQVQGDRILVSGLADYCILYVPEGADGTMLECISVQLPFKDVYTDAGAENAEVQADAEILNMDSMLLNSRKLSLKGTVALHMCLSRLREEALTTDASAEVMPATKKKKIRVCSMTAAGRFSAVAATTETVPAENPPIMEILKTEAHISEEDVKLITGKIILKGVVRLTTLYTADTLRPVTMEHAIPFTEILDLPGTEEGMDYTLDYAVTDIYCEVDRDDGDGRRFGAEVTMDIRAETMLSGDIEVLDDCFCPGRKTEISREAVKLETLADAVQESISVRKTLSLPTDWPPIAAVCTLSARPTVTSVSVEGGKVQVEGEAAIEMLYLTESGAYPIEAWRDRIPFAFTTKTAAPENAEIACRVWLLDCGFTLPDTGSADVRLHLGFDLRFTEEHTVENISEITADIVDDENRPSVVIAFSAPGDTLWSIGKRYGVSAEKIAAVNHLEPHAVLTEGTRLLVP